MLPRPCLLAAVSAPLHLNVGRGDNAADDCEHDWHDERRGAVVSRPATHPHVPGAWCGVGRERYLLPFARRLPAVPATFPPLLVCSRSHYARLSAVFVVQAVFERVTEDATSFGRNFAMTATVVSALLGRPLVRCLPHTMHNLATFFFGVVVVAFSPLPLSRALHHHPIFCAHATAPPSVDRRRHSQTG